VILDATDNFETRYLIKRLCREVCQTLGFNRRCRAA